MKENDSSIKERIEKDIRMFYDNLDKLENITDGDILKVIELSKMYASDAKSYLDKGDLYTSFSCISYAHGLLDAVIKMEK
jgi:hypothetical protein